jgi:hypothetical protein
MMKNDDSPEVLLSIFRDCFFAMTDTISQKLESAGGDAVSTSQGAEYPSWKSRVLLCKQSAVAAMGRFNQGVAAP